MRSKARRQPVPGNEAVAGTVLNVVVLIVLLVVPQVDRAAIPPAAQAAGQRQCLPLSRATAAAPPPPPPPCARAVLPGRAGLLAAGALVFHRLLSFRRWRDELVHAPRFVGAVLALLAVVAVENFCTW